MRFSIEVSERLRRKRPKRAGVWSIQPPAIWDSLRSERVLSVDSTKVEQDFLDSYQWMASQMRRRVAGYGGDLPWWGYYREAVDLRSFDLPADVGPLVRLHLDLSPEEIVVSDYAAWHKVLGGQSLPLSESEDAAEIERGGDLVRASWERVFDLEDLKEYWGRNTLQCTFEFLRLKDVVRVDYLRPRGC